MNRNTIKNILVIIAAIAVFGCRSKDKYVLEWITMGTFASCTVEAESREEANEYFEIVKTEFNKVSDSFNIYDSDSVISRINKDAWENPVRVNDYAYEVITNALDMSRRTQDSFNPVCLPIIRLWGFNGGTNSTVPSKETIDATLPLIDTSKVICSSNTVAFKDKGMMLDLGGIAKGSAVDLAYNALKESGCNEFIVNLGGNLRVSTMKDFLKIGIRDPFDKTEIIGTFKLASGKSVATSGDYERYVIMDGKKYSHIIDPRTGYPSSSSVSATVIAPNGTLADALSTASYVLGKEYCSYITEEFPGVDVLIISKDDSGISFTASNTNIFQLD